MIHTQVGMKGGVIDTELTVVSEGKWCESYTCRDNVRRIFYISRHVNEKIQEWLVIIIRVHTQ